LCDCISQLTPPYSPLHIYWCVFTKSRHGFQTPYILCLFCVEWFDVRGELSFFLNAGIVDHHCLNLFSNSNRLIIFYTCSTCTFYISRLTFTRKTFTRNRITWSVDTMASAGAFISKYHWCTRYKQESYNWVIWKIKMTFVKYKYQYFLLFFLFFFVCFVLFFLFFFYCFKRLKHTSLL
jgi:hypothetical protein